MIWLTRRQRNLSQTEEINKKTSKCLIIAAGKGSRLSKRGESKPLLPLLVPSVIERVILIAKRSGIEDFYVVTGYNGEKVRLFLDELGQRRNIKITHNFTYMAFVVDFIHPDWHMPTS